MLAFATILLSLLLCFVVLVSVMTQHPTVATSQVIQTSSTPVNKQRLMRSSLWKKGEDIRRAAALWGLDNEADVDVEELLQFTTHAREIVGEEFINQTINTVLSISSLTSIAVKQVSKKAMQVIRMLELEILGITNCPTRVKTIQTKGEAGNDEAFSL